MSTPQKNDCRLSDVVRWIYRVKSKSLLSFSFFMPALKLMFHLAEPHLYITAIIWGQKNQPEINVWQEYTRHDQSEADYRHYISTVFEYVRQELNLLLNDNMTISTWPFAETKALTMNVLSLCSLWLGAHSYGVQLESGQSVLIGHVGYLHVSALSHKKSWWLLPHITLTNSCVFCWEGNILHPDIMQRVS